VFVAVRRDPRLVDLALHLYDDDWFDARADAAG
jgi:hypothetical protein